MSVLSIYTSMNYVDTVATEARKGSGSLGTGVTDSCDCHMAAGY